jgi:aryl-alcohol dehydrogenase-like predicted oxidoreductase
MQYYSNGLSEEILGKAIKQHSIPRDEIVVLTKVGTNYLVILLMTEPSSLRSGSPPPILSKKRLFFVAWTLTHTAS